MFNAENYPIPPIDWATILPMVIVMGTGLIALIAEMLSPKRTNNVIVGISLIGLLAAGASLVSQLNMPVVNALENMVLRDKFSVTVQLLIVLATFLSILFSEGYLREKRIPFGEFYPLILWSASGGMLMVSTSNLLVIFLGLEMLSIALYVMAGMSRLETKSEESALKYFLLGAFASGFFLYGIAFFYGATGSLDLGAVAEAWNANVNGVRTLLLFGFGMMLVGLGFKSAFVPFHQWTPDVYQGAPTNVTAFMAAGSKIAAIGALFRLIEGSVVMKDLWMPALFWIAILTMIVGNLVALLQKDVKRILGYSSIGHAGYILVALLAYAKDPDTIGIGTTVYYLLSYSLMTIGAFAVVSMIARGGKESTKLEDLRGLWKKQPAAAVALLVFMISLTGVPPLAGFIGKFLIFRDALSVGLAPLAIVLGITSVLSAAYYLTIAWAAFVDEDGEPKYVTPLNAGLSATFTICVAGLIIAGVFFQPLTNWLIGPNESVQVRKESSQRVAELGPR